jgi:hypothetical protein
MIASAGTRRRLRSLLAIYAGSAALVTVVHALLR